MSLNSRIIYGDLDIIFVLSTLDNVVFTFVGTLMLFLLMIIQTSIAQCERKLSDKDFEEFLNNITVGFIYRKMEILDEKIPLIQTMVSCISEPISIETSYRYHTMTGMYYWLEQEEEKAKQSLRVAKQIKPDQQIEDHFFPEGHIIHEFYEELPVAGWIPINKIPPGEVFLFDGRTIPYRPKNAPTIFQISIDGEIQYSWLVLPTEDLPTVADIPQEIVKFEESLLDVEKANLEVEMAKETIEELSNSRRNILYFGSIGGASYCQAGCFIAVP
jgi:hypothetical protein